MKDCQKIRKGMQWGHSKETEVQKMKISKLIEKMQREDYGKPLVVTLHGSLFCLNLSGTQGREDPRVKWSAKLLFGRNAMMLTTIWSKHVRGRLGGESLNSKDPSRRCPVTESDLTGRGMYFCCHLKTEISGDIFSMLLRIHRVSKEEQAYGQATRQNLPWVVEMTQTFVPIPNKRRQLSPAMGWLG